MKEKKRQKLVKEAAKRPRNTEGAAGTSG